MTLWTGQTSAKFVTGLRRSTEYTALKPAAIPSRVWNQLGQDAKLIQGGHEFCIYASSLAVFCVQCGNYLSRAIDRPIQPVLRSVSMAYM